MSDALDGVSIVSLPRPLPASLDVPFKGLPEGREMDFGTRFDRLTRQAL